MYCKEKKCICCVTFSDKIQEFFLRSENYFLLSNRDLIPILLYSCIIITLRVIEASFDALVISVHFDPFYEFFKEN